jgi:small multidrug resistance family-3 protein
MTAILSISYFILAGLFEIGGGYLMWIALRNGRPWWVGLIGALVLVAYGWVPTLQPAGFGRVYAAYGGIFVAMALLWGWWIDGQKPDRFDIVGGLVCVVGVAIIFFAPRGQ